MTSEDSAPAPYVPALPPADIERIRDWHERAYASIAARSEQTFDYLGLTLLVPAGVQPITPTSHLLGEAVLSEAREGNRVLDMGTGCGVNAILAATRGAQVVAVDVNPRAIEAARANAERNGAAERVEVRYSDVFSEVDGAFDLIVFDPPFRWFKPRDLAETAITDEGYRAMTSFFRQARRHLAAGGRMLVFFGTSGDMGYLKRLMAENGFSWAETARLRGERDGVPVEYVTFTVT
jgi:release factor glutamine methyltransferase